MTMASIVSAVPQRWFRGLMLIACVLTIAFLLNSPTIYTKPVAAHPLRPLEAPVKPLAVLFTTFSDSPRKAQLFSNTVRNWASFLPHIQPLLFAPNGTAKNWTLAALAREHGWLVADCPGVNAYGTPKLKPMYSSVYGLHPNAPLHGFANGDILFDGSLVTTLRRIVTDLAVLNTTLVTGRRWTYNVRNESAFASWSPQNVTRLLRNASIDRTDAEDYFIVSRDFPWAEIKDVVIGRPAYDNYLVARSIQLNVTTIDATATTNALHQVGAFLERNTKKDGNYNKKIIGKFNYYAGLTSKTWLMTKYDYKGEVFVDRKTIDKDFLKQFSERFDSI